MGVIFDIQRCSYHDGPGIRTTVFLKGCQLRCAWCHNPESFRINPQLQFLKHMCTGCGKCAQICPQGAHAVTSQDHTVDFSRCTACGLCTGQCPGNALKILGWETSAREIMDTVLRDRAYYEASGGGLTVSGGEPTMQPEFLTELLELAKMEGIHTCLETNGYIPEFVLKGLLDKVDLFLLDYKVTGAQALFEHTRASGGAWQRCLEILQQHGSAVILRLPVIPGINDTQEHFRTAAALKRNYSCIRQVEVMPYHTIGAAKWEQLGYDYKLSDLAGATARQKALWQQSLDDLL